MKRNRLFKSAALLKKGLLTLLLTALLTLVVITRGEAQFQNQVEVLKPDLSTWPNLVTQFRVFNSQGAFVKGLTLEDVHLRENDQVVAPDTLEMLEPGVRLIVAINEGPTLANRFAQVARIDKIKTALLKWAESEPAVTMDTFSLVSNTSLLAVDLRQPEDWVKVVNDYQPELKTMKPGLESLATAVEMTSGQDGNNLQNTAMLYVTPMPTEAQFAGLQDLFSQAMQANVRLFIWLVGPETYNSDPKAAPLREAAETSNGAFLVFTGAEDLPNLETILDPLSFVYSVSYRSQIKQSGDYNFSVNVNQDGNLLESDPIVFSINVQPPNPIFLDPPVAVERAWTETRRKKDSVLAPEVVPVEILVEFPDGFKRGLVYSRLFIDNRLADENVSAPFNIFEWNISGLTESGTHIMSATIQDEAGMIVETTELAVEVVVLPKPLTWLGKIVSRFSIQVIALFFVIVLAGVLLILLAVRTMRVNHKSRRVQTRLLHDPVTQPIQIENETITPLSRKEAEETWPHLAGVGLASARLVLISYPAPRENIPAEIAIGEREITLGSDEKKVNVFLDSPLISPLHARIESDEQQHFRVFDTGSGSGTWLNYAPVSHYGARLEHGDMIQFGKVAYRFEIYGAQAKKLKVEPL